MGHTSCLAACAECQPLKASNSPTRLLDHNARRVYTFNTPATNYKTASAACASQQPVPGVKLKGTLWIVNGYSEHQFVERYFRAQNPSMASYW